MAQNIPARLEERVQFAAWRRPAPDSGRYQVTDPTLDGDEIPDWTLHQARRIRTPGTAPLVRSTWVRRPGTSDPLLLVDLHVADSAEAARPLALRVLGDFQTPHVARRTDTAIGEVAFGDNSPYWIVFLRGNLVVSVRNGGRELTSVLDAAAALDAALTRMAQPGTKD